MIKASYPQLLKRIANSTGLSVEEVERKVEAKKAKLSDLISKEGAAQIVASELGVSFDKQKVKIDELLVGMRRISLTAKILKILSIRSFKTKNAESKVANLLIADETGNTRCVLWDVNHIKQLEEGKIKEGNFVEIKDGSVREGTTKEVHLGSISGFSLSNEILENVVTEEQLPEKNLAELSENDRVSVRAAIVQIFEPRFFYVCPECGKKPLVDEGKHRCSEHGTIIPQERALLTLVIDDGTATMRAICFSEVIKKIFNLGEEEIKDLSRRQDKAELLGKEMRFIGRVRKNKAFDNLELVLIEVQEIDPEQLVKELERR